jgi:hypothetical protein
MVINFKFRIHDNYDNSMTTQIGSCHAFKPLINLYSLISMTTMTTLYIKSYMKENKGYIHIYVLTYIKGKSTKKVVIVVMKSEKR